ncbi:hypothetical protein GGI12_005498, partial [Dipsacomyces acuminosporus]
SRLLTDLRNNFSYCTQSMVNSDKDGSTYIEQDLNFNPSGSPSSTPAHVCVELPTSDAKDASSDPATKESVLLQGDTTTTTTTGAAAIQSTDAGANNEGILAPGLAAPVIDGKESVEFQIGIHVVDLFDIFAARANEGQRSSRRYQLVHANPLLRHMRETTANMLRRSPSRTSAESLASDPTEAGEGGEADEGQPGQSPSDVQEAGNADVTLTEVLDGLQYVVDYRLKGRQQPHLDISLMRRLCDALLLTMTQVQGSFLHRRLTEDARSAYFLFGQFIEEVLEFQQCVGEKSAADLRRALRLHKRIAENGPDEERLALVTMLRLVLACLPQGHDWRDLVDEHEQRSLLPIIEAYGRIIDDDKQSYHMPVTGGPVYPPPALYFDRTVEKLAVMFKTDVFKGLTSEQVVERRGFYGRNELPKPVRRPWWKIVWAQLTDLMILMLCAAIIATAIDGEWKSSIVLGAVVILNTIVGSWQEIKAGKALSALENLGTTHAHVIRSGMTESVDAADLVPGDLVEIGEGESVPADLRLVSCAQLEIVESVLTGESLGVPKDPKAIKVRTRQLPLGDCKGNAFMSTLVLHGRGRGIVIRTGAKTEIGKISAAINRSAAHTRRTPIQKKLTKLGLWLVVLALALCAVIVICGVSWKRKF